MNPLRMIVILKLKFLDADALFLTKIFSSENHIFVERRNRPFGSCCDFCFQQNFVT